VHYYGEAGHFYTAYLVALAVGFDDQTAFHIAFFTQMPDEVSELDATHMALASVEPVLLDDNADRAVRERDVVQRGGHSLTGRPSAEERARRMAVTSGMNPASPEFGLSVHALGDSFAHSTVADEGVMYNPVSGHLAQFVTDKYSPDYIALRPKLYLAYVHSLYTAFSKAAAKYPEHQVAALVQDEAAVTAMAEEIGRLPDEEAQIKRIRELAEERLKRKMNAYAPDKVPDRPYAQFAADPGPGKGNSTPEARAAAKEIPLWRAQGFDAMQASTIPAPLVGESGPLNTWGFAHDAAVATGGEVKRRVNEVADEAAREWRNAQLTLQSQMRQFFGSTYGYSPF
jgi:hypothetical protein